MQLNPGERSILAYFPSSDAAQEAVQALQKAGYPTVQLDRISRYGDSNDAQYNNPINGQAQTQTGLTLFSAESDNLSNNDTRILLGADPSVEGYAPEGYGVAGGKAYMVTVVTSEEKVDHAVGILKDRGGDV